MKDSGDFEDTNNELELDGGFSMSPDADGDTPPANKESLNPRGNGDVFDGTEQSSDSNKSDNLSSFGSGLSLDGGDDDPAPMQTQAPQPDIPSPPSDSISGLNLSVEGDDSAPAPAADDNAMNVGSDASPDMSMDMNGPSNKAESGEMDMSGMDMNMSGGDMNMSGGDMNPPPQDVQADGAADQAPPEQQSEKPETSEPPEKTEGLAAEDAPPAEDDEEIDTKNMRLGDRLLAEGHINQDQLEVALHEKSKAGGLLGEIMVELGFISPDILAGILAESTGYSEFEPGNAVLDPEALELIDKATALRFQILPVSLENNVAHIAMVDPYDVMTLDRLRQLLPRDVKIQPMIAPPAALNASIDRAYGYASSTKDILSELTGKQIDLEGIEGLSEDNAYSHPIVRLVNALVIDAVKMGASDLHFEPEENFVRLRYRVDGILITVNTIHKEYWQAIAQRLKIMSGMNIADKLLPQDGRFFLNVGGREADFRVSSLPTVNGENFVLRVLDKQSGIMPLEKLGFSDHNMNLIRKSQSRPEGIIIVTGPTGSGKTTSLYSMLNAVNTPDVNIMTLEDPVEYSLPMIRQTHVRANAGLTFADGVKALLRQDPDIIFVGEVRDAVTAEQALKAAMTGHQVYTSLHTNDCFGAIPRLLDLGLQPGMLAGAIIASFAQRLVRRLCDCKEMKTATEEECRLLDIDPSDPPKIGHPKGCPKCMNSGYKGRTAVVEILFTNEAINDVIADGGQKTQLKKVAREHGFKSMLDDGIDKILKGQTSLESLMKTVDFSERL